MHTFLAVAGLAAEHVIETDDELRRSHAQKHKRWDSTSNLQLHSSPSAYLTRNGKALVGWKAFIFPLNHFSSPDQ
eukprot:1160238-Pelagomonas_calceolata.AAC.7